MESPEGRGDCIDAFLVDLWRRPRQERKEQPCCVANVDPVYDRRSMKFRKQRGNFHPSLETSAIFWKNGKLQMKATMRILDAVRVIDEPAIIEDVANGNRSWVQSVGARVSLKEASYAGPEVNSVHDCEYGTCNPKY